MSNSPLSSQEEDHFSIHNQAEEKPHYKRPEFILIDDREENPQFNHLGTDSSEKQEKENVKNHPLSLRFLCLLGFIFCLLFGLGIMIWSIVLTLLATLSLFQNRGLNQGVKSFWTLSLHSCVAGFGFALGLISPTLGLGLIALYFSIAGQLISDDWLRKIIRRSLNRI